MEEVQKERRRKHRHGKSRHGRGKRKFWRRFILYFIYFSTIFLSLYYLFDRSDMYRLLKKDPDIFCWKVFGTSLLFAFGLAFWMRRDPKLTGK